MKTLYQFRTLSVLLFVLFLSADIVKAQITVGSGHYLIDKSLGIIICNEIPEKIAAGTSTVTLDKAYTFSSPVSAVQIGTAYKVARNDTTYKLYFTRIPLINLTVKNTISESEIGGFIQITDTIGTVYSSDMGIKIRGNYSSTLPKKPYRVQLWSDTVGTTKDDSVLGMRSDKRWILLAMYNEKLRLNNKLSEELWTKMHKLYYADLEPNAHAAIRTRYVEVFLNGAYQGVYLCGEDMDRKELALKKQKTAGTGGELYKGDSWDAGTLFYGVPDLPQKATTLWGGWELEYPDADQTDWKNLYNLTNFVVNSADSTFKQQISSKIREDNFADYFIFLNLLRIEDNQGKNLFLARYDEKSPYFIAPWDLDGTWGYYWSGDQKNVTNDILTNNFFNRLISTTSNFKTQMATRWFSLRQNLLSIDSLYTAIDEKHNFLMSNGVYERENMVWSGAYLSYGEDELNYIKNWIQNRASWLDSYFENFVGDQPIIYSFSASVPESHVVLNWSANCPAIYSFDVEASSDSLSWHTITPTSILTNDSIDCHYSFTDSQSEVSSSYYRLKVTDKKSGISYSSVLYATVDLAAGSTVIVFPNPVATTLQIRGDVEKVNIYSLLGNCVYESDSLATNKIDVQRFATGMYVVRVTEKNGTTSSHKIFVNK